MLSHYSENWGAAHEKWSVDKQLKLQGKTTAL
jgi:hypothetical protein